MSGMPPVNRMTGPSDYRGLVIGAVLAAALSTSSILMLGFGMAGSSGNSVLTGALLLGSLLSIGIVCFRRRITLAAVDYLYLAFVATVLLSFLLNGGSSNAKEGLLLAISLAAYPAGRLVTGADLAVIKPSFLFSIGLIVALGTAATAIALVQQWDHQHGKPIVFGFDASDAAPGNFLQSLSLLILAAVTMFNLTARKTLLISVLIFLPIAIFAASLVRFTFIALAGGLFVALVFAGARQRKHVFTIGLVIFVATATGLAARYAKARIFADFALEKTTGVITWQRPPSCDLVINPNNSIAIRKALTLDAFYLIPRAGPVGTGLDSFMDFSCIKNTEVHNSFLQTGVEFGWAGGILLVLAVILVWRSIAPLARHGGAPLFVLCSLSFAILLSMAHGRISRDLIFFVLLGIAGGVVESTRLPSLIRPGDR
jgi:hypothetical protein